MKDKPNQKVHGFFLLRPSVSV